MAVKRVLNSSDAEKRQLQREIYKLVYRLMVYADPASTAGQKSNALSYIQTKRAWIEANAAKLSELL